MSASNSSSTRIEVDLGARRYPILIGFGLLESLGTALREHGLKNEAALVVTDANTGPRYFEAAAQSLRCAGFSRVVQHGIPAGETGKSWDEYARGCDALLRSFPETGEIPVVIALGGGVVGDLAGFVAGTFRRGVPYVQVPTSLLSAVDSSVGGKVGVNHGGVKNIMGMIYQPRLVLTDLKLLCTLGAREIRSGMAEVIKYGAVCSPELFELLEREIERVQALDPELLTRVVAECCAIKARVVREDELDTAGVRIVLNFGHTVGHALETAAAGSLTHGEAIAIGMLAATRIALKLELCAESFYGRLKDLLGRAGLPATADRSAVLLEHVMRAMRSDKKFHSGANRFVLPAGLGSWVPREGVPDEIVEQVVNESLTPVADTDPAARSAFERSC